MKKLFALLLAVIMVVGLFAGCQKTPAADTTTAGKVDDSKETTAAPVEDDTTAGEVLHGIELKDSWDDEEPLEMPVACAYYDRFQEAGMKSYTDTRIGQQVKDWFNIEIPLFAAPENLNDYFMNCLSTGDLPYVLYIASDDVINAYYAAGKLVNLDDYAELLPNHIAAMGPTAPSVVRAKFPDGGLYQWYGDANKGSVLINSYTGSGFTNTQIAAFRAYGLENYPTHFSDYDKFWRTIMEMDEFKTAPDGTKAYAFSFYGTDTYGNPNMAVPLEFNTKLGTDGTFGASGGVQYDIETDKFVNPYATYPMEQLSHGARYFNEWYRDGILDPECFADTQQTITEKQMNGYIITALMNGAQEATVNASLSAIYGNDDHSSINTQRHADGVNHLYRPGTGTGWNIALTTAAVESGEMDRICAFLDWARSEEGLLLYGSGEEGVDYEWVDGMRNPIGQYRKDVEEGFSSDYAYTTGMWESYTFYRLTGASWANCSIDDQPFRMNRMSNVATELSCNDVQKQFLADMGWKTYTDCFNECTVMYDDRFIPVVPADDTDIQDAITWFKEKQNEWGGKILRSENFDADFATYVDEMANSEELNGLVEWYNEAYEEVKAAGLGYQDLNPGLVID